MNISIRKAAQVFHVSARTLRYYEQIGLLQSTGREARDARMYDEAALARLRQIVVLRKLRIPLEQIGVILNSEDARTALAIFQENLRQADAELAALTTIRDSLRELLARLSRSAQFTSRLNLLDDEELRKLTEALTVDTIPLGQVGQIGEQNNREEPTMEELNNANDILCHLHDVRILYLPPATVAASQYEGENPEDVAGQRMNQFIVESGLCRIKPDLRMYGFNNPNPVDETNAHGYEFWVTIPEDFEVPAPLTKKQFAGGFYAAHMIPMGAFEEWGWLFEWGQKNGRYTYERREPFGMEGLLEEHLNVIGGFQELAAERKAALETPQLDLLLPVRLVEKAEE